MKCKVLKTSLTPWGQLNKDDVIEAEAGKLKALTQLGIIEEIKEKPKAKKKKTDA